MKTAAQLRALRQSFNVNKWNPKASEEIKEFGTPMLGLWRAVGSVLRTFGQSVESMGAGFQSSTAYEETLSKHQAVAPFESRVPALSAKSFVAPSATVLGQVSMGAGSSVWYGACIRGDTHPVSIGKRTSIQDRATVHCDSGPAAIGNNVSIGAVKVALDSHATQELDRGCTRARWRMGLLLASEPCFWMASTLSKVASSLQAPSSRPRLASLLPRSGPAIRPNF